MKTSHFLNYAVLAVLIFMGAYWLGLTQGRVTCKQDAWATQRVHDFEIQGYSEMLVAVGQDLDKKRNELIREGC